MLKSLLEIILHIDFREHAKIMSFEGSLYRDYGIVKAHVYYFGVMVGGHLCSPLLLLGL